MSSQGLHDDRLWRFSATVAEVSQQPLNLAPGSSGLALTWRSKYPMVAVLMVFIAASCSGETAVPIDLNSTTTVVTEPPPSLDGQDQDPLDPNAEQNRITLAYAEQQCLDDPELDQGYVQIIDPSTQEKVGEVTADCAEVRSRQQ